MGRTSLDLHPIAGRIGAEVRGVDLAGAVADETIAAIRAALLQWKVLFFRDQELDPSSHRTFGARFGPVTTAHPTVPGLRDHPDVLEVDARRSVASQWHTDVTFVESPPFGSILHAVVVPPYGGDTLWANTAAAYEDLPAELRTLADTLDAVHTNRFDYAGPNGEANEALRSYAKIFQSERFETIHPVVRVVPETGERALFLGGFARNIVALRSEDSASLLRLLRNHVERHENVVRWRWRPGDVAFWDNRATQHRAIADFGDQPRRLHRVTIAGDVPVGVDGRRSRALRGDSRSYVSAAA